MSNDEKPIHVPRANYPQAVYPAPATLSTPEVSGDTPETDTVHLLDYWHILVAHRWTVIAIFVTVVTITTIATFKQVPIYRATTTIQIDRENTNILSLDVYKIESGY